MKKIILIILILVCQKNLIGQPKWPIPMYLPEYGVYLKITNDVNLNDTAKIPFSQNTYFRFVFKDSRGKSYCEVYRNNKLYEKGYYENSLDTLKKYSSAAKMNNTTGGKIKVSKYFQPLKNGEWIETKRSKFIKKNYEMGIEIFNNR